MSQRRFLLGGSAGKSGFPRTTISSLDDMDLAGAVAGDIIVYDGTKWVDKTISWKEPVISIFDNTAALPASPAIGDRYIALVTANGWTANHIYEYTSAANSWTNSSTGIDTSSNNYALILYIDGTVIYAAVNNVGVYKSIDTGVTWTLVGKTSTGLPSGSNFYQMLKVGSTLFIGTNTGVYISTNGGASWATSNTGLVNLQVTGLTYDSVNGKIWLSTYGDGPYYSTTGASWTPFITGLASTTYYSIFATGGTIYLGANDKVYFNTGLTWTESTTHPAAGLKSNFVVSGTSLLVCGNGTPYVSTDSGVNWTLADTGLTGTGAVQQLVATTGTIVYACTTTNGISRTANSGTLWADYNTGLTPTYLACYSITYGLSKLWTGTFVMGDNRVFSTDFTTAFSDTTPADGYATYVKSADTIYTFDGVNWVSLAEVDPVFLARAATTSHYTGFPNRADPLGWDTSTKAVWLYYPGSGGTFDLYVNAVKYTVAGGIAFPIPDVTGLYWCWVTIVAGVPTANVSLTFPGFNKCLVASVYHNAATGQYSINEERHWMGRDRYWHEYTHETIGARYASGLTGTFTNTTFSIDTGEIYDEDIEHIFDSAMTVLDCHYKNGSAAWAWDVSNTNPYKLNGTSMRYNNGTTLTDVPDNNYVAIWIFATNRTVNPIISIIGQRVDVNINNARNNNDPSTLSLGSLPTAEMKLLYRLIFRQVSTTPTFIEAADYRNVTTVPTQNFQPTSHSSLSNLNYSVAGHTGFITQAADEIATTTLKATPTTSDFLLIEDAAASNVKKSITISSLVPWLYGTGSPPSAAGLVDGTLFFKYTP